VLKRSSGTPTPFKKGHDMSKRILITGTLASIFASGIGHAADAPAPSYALTSNLGIFSQYVFRGLTQTDRKPALQGGFDYARANGLYAGTWASNISWLSDSRAYSSGGSLEWDFYGGMKGNLGSSDLTYDLGTLYYYYPGTQNTAANALAIKADTWEVYGALGWKWLSAKYSYSIQNETFGVRDSQGTYYLDLTATLPLADLSKQLDGFSLVAHWGYQKYSGTDPRNATVAGRQLSNDELYSYKDVKLGLSYALPKDFTIGAFYTKAYDANVLGYGATNETGAGGNTGVYPHNLAKATGTVFIQKTF
jgi:uncharacterized protein (TIGR02001 family)